MIIALIPPASCLDRSPFPVFKAKHEPPEWLGSDQALNFRANSIGSWQAASKADTPILLLRVDESYRKDRMWPSRVKTRRVFTPG